MSETIQSPSNPKIKRLIRLKEKRNREREGVIVIEGRPEIDRFLETNLPVQEVYFCPALMEDSIILEKIPKETKRYEVSQSVFTKLAYGHRLEGLMCVAEKPVSIVDDVPQVACPLYVVIEQVEKPGNLGAILRSCDGASVTAIFVCDPRVDLYNPNVIRASLGTVFSQCVVALSNEEALEFLQDQNATIYAATPECSKKYTDVDGQKACAVVVGAEKEGLTSFWLNQKHQNINIPMLGKADSLNVSVSTAVILYEFLRQRSI